MFRASHLSEGVRLTAPAGDIFDQRHPSHIHRRDIRSQHDASQSVGMVTADPEYWPVPGGVVLVEVPSEFLLGHPGPHDFLHGQWYPPLYPSYAYTLGRLPEGPDILDHPGVGEDLNSAVAVGYADSTPRGDVGPSSEDGGMSPRCGTDPGNPIHLTTSIRVSSSQVSYPHLVEEVCPYSAWETHWY